jgi:hypothetical protein
VQGYLFGLADLSVADFAGEGEGVLQLSAGEIDFYVVFEFVAWVGGGVPIMRLAWILERGRAGVRWRETSLILRE